MKKIIFSALFCLGSLNCFPAWNLDFSAGVFFNSDGSVVRDNLNFAMIVDMNASGFSDFEMLAGDFFSSGENVRADGSYKTLFSGNLKYFENEDLYLARLNSGFDNDDYGFSGGEKIALVVWDSSSNTASVGDKYFIFTSSMAGLEKLDEVNDWQIPLSGNGVYSWYGVTENMEGEIPESFFTLSKTVGAVPEAGYCAAVFGLAALVFAARRRRK